MGEGRVHRTDMDRWMDGWMDGWHGNQTPVNTAKWKRTFTAVARARECSHPRQHPRARYRRAENSPADRLSAERRSRRDHGNARLGSLNDGSLLRSLLMRIDARLESTLPMTRRFKNRVLSLIIVSCTIVINGIINWQYHRDNIESGDVTWEH